MSRVGRDFVALFLIATCFLLPCSCIFDGQQNVKALNSLEGLTAVRGGEPDNRVAVLAVWHEDSSNNEKFETEFLDFVKSNESLFRVYHVDCEFFSEEELSVCQNDEAAIRRLPKVILSVPPATTAAASKNSTASEIIYGGALNSKDIATFAKSQMPNYAIRKPTLSQIQSQILPDPTHPKVVIFTNKNESAPLLKALSAYYYERMIFIEIHESQKEIVSQFQITKYPTLMLLSITEDGRVAATPYADQLKIGKLITFLDKQALKEKVPFSVLIQGASGEKPTGSKQQQPKQDSQKFQSAFEDEEQQNDSKNDRLKAEVLTIKKYEKQLLQEDHVVVLHVIGKDKVAHDGFAELQSKLAGAAVIYEFTVDSNEKQEFAEKVLKVKSLPAIKVFPFSKDRKTLASASSLYGPSAKADAIFDDIEKSIDDESFSVNDEKMFQMAISQSLQEGLSVHILFTNQSGSVLPFKVAGKVDGYKKKVKFVTFSNAPKSVLQQFGVNSLPKIAVLFRNVKEEEKDTPIQQEQVQATQYSGKLEYNEYVKFVQMFSGPVEDRIAGNTKTTRKVAEITSMSQFDKICKTTTRYCFIGLLNGDPAERMNEEDEEEDSEKVTKLAEQLKTLKVVKDKMGSKPVSFGWIDAVCHSKLFAQLGIDESVPSYIVYSAKTKQYARMVGRFEESSMETFSHAVLQGKRGLQSLSQELSIVDGVDCVTEHARIKRELEEYEKAAQAENEFDEEIKREMMEEERQRKLKLEAELKAERPKKKKSKSKRRSDL